MYIFIIQSFPNKFRDWSHKNETIKDMCTLNYNFSKYELSSLIHHCEHCFRCSCASWKSATANCSDTSSKLLGRLNRPETVLSGNIIRIHHIRRDISVAGCSVVTMCSVTCRWLWRRYCPNTAWQRCLNYLIVQISSSNYFLCPRIKSMMKGDRLKRFGLEECLNNPEVADLREAYEHWK